MIAQGAFKSVWLGYDVENGREIAWNAVNILPLSHREKKRVIMEVRILETVKNKRIIEFYGSWFNKAKQEVVFITEILRSGTLKRFIRQVKQVRLRVVRKWCKQILEGLAYLHEKDPPLIHRDLKCENIFIKGDTGDIKIGDFGLSTQVARDQKTYSILGTPEFMSVIRYTVVDIPLPLLPCLPCLLFLFSLTHTCSSCLLYPRPLPTQGPRALHRGL